MRERTQSLIDEFDVEPPPVDAVELAEVKAFLAWVGRQSLHVPRVSRIRAGPRQRRSGTEGDRRLRPGDSSGLARDAVHEAQPEGGRAGDGAARARPDEGELARHRAPPGVSGLHRRQAMGRRRRGDRRAALPRAVHDIGLQGERAGDPDPARKAQGRSRAGGRFRRTATTPRRSPRSSSPIPVSRCSRWIPTTCSRSRWGSWAWANVSACGCSSGATSSIATSSAWCASRATVSTPRTASGWGGS